MSRKDKLLQRIARLPRDFTWSELETLLGHLGFEMVRRGKTAGSRRRFIHENGAVISLHKPHPGNILRAYQVKQVVEILVEEGLL